MDENYICVYVILELKKKRNCEHFQVVMEKKQNTYINVIIGKKINK